MIIVRPMQWRHQICSSEKLKDRTSSLFTIDGKIYDGGTDIQEAGGMKWSLHLKDHILLYPASGFACGPAVSSSEDSKQVWKRSAEFFAWHFVTEIDHTVDNNSNSEIVFAHSKPYCMST